MAGLRVRNAVTPCLPAPQSSADKALDRTGVPLADWAALKSDLRITKRIKFLQRCGLDPGDSRRLIVRFTKVLSRLTSSIVWREHAATNLPVSCGWDLQQ